MQIKRKKTPFFIKKNDYKGMKIEINCTAYVNEIDPHYCDVIRRRWTSWAEENGVNAGTGALK